MGKILRCDGMRKPSGLTDFEYIEPPSARYREDFQDWFKSCVRIARLSENRVLLSSQHSDDDCWASVATEFSYRVSEVRVCNGFHLLEPDRQRRAIAHELYHVHVESIVMPYTSLKEIVSSDAWKVTEKTALQMEEHTVTLMEWSGYKLYPLPPVFKKPKLKRKRVKKDATVKAGTV